MKKCFIAMKHEKPYPKIIIDARVPMDPSLVKDLANLSFFGKNTSTVPKIYLKFEFDEAVFPGICLLLKETGLEQIGEKENE